MATTSWDDGSIWDLRIAETLASFGASGTFYICRNAVETNLRLSDGALQELASMPNIEIGAHSMTHPDFRKCSKGQRFIELRDSKAWLEDLLQMPIVSFCYPKGRHRRAMAEEVSQAGYLNCRTTMSGRTDLEFSRLRMPTTFQLYPHGRASLLRHAVKEGHARGVTHYALDRESWDPRADVFVRRYLTKTHPAPRMLHVWGHGWELQAQNLWSSLGDLLAVLAEVAPDWQTNASVAATAKQ